MAYSNKENYDAFKRVKIAVKDILLQLYYQQIMVDFIVKTTSKTRT